MKFHHFILLLVAASGVHHLAFAAPDEAELELRAPDAEENDNLGTSVALGRSHVLAGAPGEDTGGVDLGTVYHFVLAENGDWQWNTRLFPSEGDAGDAFGTAVDLNAEGDVALIGAPGVDTLVLDDAGAAYVLYRGDNDQWSEAAILTASTRSADGLFGSSVALDTGGFTAVVGAPGHEASAELRGGAFWFSKDQGGDDVWGAGVVRFGEAADDEFGAAVAISGDIVAVSAPMHGDDGKVYVYQRTVVTQNDWLEVAGLTGDVGVALFGKSVAVGGDGDYVLVGTNAKRVYVYARNEPAADDWGQIQIVQNDNLGFGEVVTALGSSVAISALTSEPPSVMWYEIEGSAVNFVDEYIGSNTVFGDEFGVSTDIALDFDEKPVLLVGAPEKEVGRGSAYLWENASPAGSAALPSVVVLGAAVLGALATALLG